MRVLLIEDHVPLAGLLARELTDKHGHEVTQARDPLSARAKCQTSGYDIAVVDLLYEHLNVDFEAVLARGELTARSTRGMRQTKPAASGERVDHQVPADMMAETGHRRHGRCHGQLQGLSRFLVRAPGKVITQMNLPVSAEGPRAQIFLSSTEKQHVRWLA